MFYNGDLQSGIALALRDKKSVACFITDNGSESSRWQSEYLGDEQVAAALTSNAVTLRLEAASQEATYFSEYYPIETAPALIIINNGRLLLDIRSGEEGGTFKSRVLTTFIRTYTPSGTPNEASRSRSRETSTSPSTHTEPPGVHPSDTPISPAPRSQTHISSPPSSTPATTSQQAQLERHHTQAPVAPIAPPNIAASPQGASSATATSSSSGSAIQNLLEERRRRLDVHKKKTDASEEAERKTKADARQDAVTAAPDSAKAKQAIYAQQQRKRQHEARLERERILRRIEQDKADRKEKEERRKALARAETEGNEFQKPGTAERYGLKGRLDSENSEQKPNVTRSSGCSVQVRLFDGTTIRNQFTHDQTLSDIREWVDKETSDDTPYTFKQILAPFPNRPFDISEEEKSLIQMDFVPSATLVMTPVQGYIAAYSSANPGTMSKIIYHGYNTLARGAGMIIGTLRTFLGVGQAEPQSGNPSAHALKPAASEPQVSRAASGINIRTLSDQPETQDDHQLYNGNQLNFEPRSNEKDQDE